MRTDDAILGELLKLAAPRPHARVARVLSLYEEAERLQGVGGASAGDIIAGAESRKKDNRPPPVLSATFPDIATRRAVLDEHGVTGDERSLTLRLFEVADAATSEVIAEVTG